MSRAPVAVRRTSLAPALLPFQVPKSPPTRTLPLPRGLMARTAPLGPAPPELGRKVVSVVPSALRRAMFRQALPLTWENSPPMRIFPSVCGAMTQTVRGVYVAGRKTSLDS